MFPSIFISVKFKQPPKAPPISVTLAGIVIDSKLRHAEKQYAGIDVILPKLFTVFNEELEKAFSPISVTLFGIVILVISL